MPTQQALDTIAEASVLTEIATATDGKRGLPAELSFAQCAIESHWLDVSPGNNCFGIKPNARESGEQYCLTHEWISGQSVEMRLKFATYNSIADCFKDHAYLITSKPVYQTAWNQWRESDGGAEALQALLSGIAKYYASAKDYVPALNSILRMLSVQQAIAKARAQKRSRN